MARLTVSTNGVARDANYRMIECHQVDDLEASRLFEPGAEVVKLRMSGSQALDVVLDLLLQLVDAGTVKAWDIKFPERDRGER